MRKITSILLLIFINAPILLAYEEVYGPLNSIEKKVLTLWWDTTCKNIDESEIPTIFIPGLLASWYSEEWFNNTKIKRWIPDPITNVYDTLFYTFKQNWYELKDVFYKWEFEIDIVWNPSKSLYLFWYDWKKDNKITAKLLRDLILKIRLKYEEENWCDIETVNLIGHSMWWLVARAMLEDMCASEEDIKNYYKNIKFWKIKEIKSSFCYNYTKINKLITIATPHRWSPKSLALWEKWDLNTVEKFFVATPLKLQLWSSTNESLYKTLHWYNEKIPNWIISMWQLLPDIKNNNIYNNELRYLYKNYPNNTNNNLVSSNKKYYIKNYNHPQNSFLEELNRSENIEKMFSNISWKFSLFYSNKTWNVDKNNVLEYDISNKYSSLYTWYKYKTITTHLDNTYDIKKYDIKDIYSKYEPYNTRQNKRFYNYLNTIRNESWLWWDWTVPSKNLRLVANDLYNTKEIPKSDKFESIEINCYDKLWWESELSKKLWSVKWWLCAHSFMPVITAIQVFEEISWNKISFDNEWNYSLHKERDLLYSNLWHVDYKDTIFKRRKVFRPSLLWLTKTEDFIETWIYNNTRINNLFDKYYNPFFKWKEDINEFINNRSKKNYDRKAIEFTWAVWAVNSLIRYEILSPINIIIEDEQWRKIWIDPETWMIVNEIPWAWTSGDTEWSNEPEFFLIPKVWTWEILHKIHTYWTGNWKYHIVMDDFSNDNNKLVIAWVAKKDEEEKYIVWIKDDKSSYKKLDSSNNSRKLELGIKYKSILEKLYKLLDEKYSDKQKNKLKVRLIKFQENGYWKFKENEKVVYLVDKIIEYLD